VASVRPPLEQLRAVRLLTEGVTSSHKFIRKITHLGLQIRMQLDGTADCGICHDSFVKRFFKILCVILAIGWLPVTQHCRLEAMGVALMQCEHAGSANADSDSCARDGCSALEGGSYKLTTAKLSVPAPTLLEPIFIILVPTALKVEVAKVEFAPEERARPLNWVPSWQFVRRAAPPSRAPSVSLA